MFMSRGEQKPTATHLTPDLRAGFTTSTKTKKGSDFGNKKKISMNPGPTELLDRVKKKVAPPPPPFIAINRLIHD